jgi:hypothetical protein
MTAPISFAVYQAARDTLDAALVQAGNALSETRQRLADQQGIAPFGKMNLTPDCIRLHPDYRRDNAALNASFEALRALNGTYARQFRRELALERDARRAAGLHNRSAAL